MYELLGNTFGPIILEDCVNKNMEIGRQLFKILVTSSYSIRFIRIAVNKKAIELMVWKFNWKFKSMCNLTWYK